jgi:hypothetical protein
VTSNSPFSRRRARTDLVTALPALGMLVGAVLGVLVGFSRGDGGPVTAGGVGIAAGLVVGLLLRHAFRSGPADRP